MDDLAARALGLGNGFGALGPEELAPGLRPWIAEGIECRDGIVAWVPFPRGAELAPGNHPDLTGWECSETRLHLEDFVPVESGHADLPVLGADAQRTLLRQGIALALEVGRLAGELAPPIPVRCIIAVNDTCGTFRFHRIRPGEQWLLDDLDGYGRGYSVLIDFRPRRSAHVDTGQVSAEQRAALFALVDLLAPAKEEARTRLVEILGTAGWSAFDPEEALIEALVDGVAGGLAVWLRGLADAEAIRQRLAQLPTCPGGLVWPPESAAPEYLRALGDRCRAAGSALIGVRGGADDLVLGLLPVAEVARFVALAAVARVEVTIHGSEPAGS